MSGSWQYQGFVLPPWEPEKPVTLDQWYAPLSAPTFLPPPVYHDGETLPPIVPTLPPESITLDKWWQPLAAPIFLPPPVYHVGATVPPLFEVLPESITLDKWFAPLSEPVLPLPPIPQCESVYPEVMRGHYYHDARGLYRVFNDAEYRFYRDNAAPPEEGDTPWATASSLPDTPADAFADGTWYLSVSYFNGVLDSGFLPVGPRGETYLTLEISGGEALDDRPQGPLDWRLEQQAGGVVRVVAVYLETGDAAADQWALAYTTDGGDPPEDDPDVTATILDGLNHWVYDLPAQAHGTTIKVRLQTRRDDTIYSSGSVVKTATADATGPTAPVVAERWPGRISGDA